MTSTHAPAVRRVVTLAIATGAASLIVTVTRLMGLNALVDLPAVTVVTIAAAFALAEAVPVHIEHRRESVSITLSTVPFVIGLFALTPVMLIAARLLGAGAALVFHRKQRNVKLLVNLVSFWVQTWVSVLVFRGLGGSFNGPDAWPAVFVAVVVGDLAQTVVLTSAISLFQQRWEPSLLRSAALSSGAALVETSLGLVALSLLVDQPAALVPLGVVTALALVSYRTHRSLGERHRELGQLFEFTAEMGDALPDGRVIPTVLDHARDLLHAERAWLLLPAEDGPGVQIVTASDVTIVDGESHRAGPLHAARILGGALLMDANDRGRAELVTANSARQLLVAPLHSSSGPIGALVVADRCGEVRRFEQDDLRLFTIVANQAAVALENDRLIVRLQEKAAESEHQLLHDALTGLPNRVLFARELESALATGTSAAVLLVDLDRFKEVNDTLGHQNGDLLLQQVGTRLRGTLRRNDVIARLGGDEFAVLLRDIQGDQAAVQAARGIVELISQPFVLGDLSIDVGTSIGIAVAPRDGTDAVTLLQRADVAMYTAKDDQTDVELYSPARDGYSPERLTLVSDLRHAIHEGQLEVHYQPQLDLFTGQVTGVEALVRWAHPTRGTVFPDQFIGVAEHTGLIQPLTTYVLGESLATWKEWKLSGLDLRVSVNVSARSLAQTLVDEVIALLRHLDVPASALCLEVTESSIMSEPRRTTAILEALRGLGVTIAIDDFGIGHSSLAYVKQLPVGEIKVDKSFVMSMIADHNDQAIVDTVLNLARNLGLAVIAEGIEDEPTAARLRSMGCGAGQGYLYARPMPNQQLLAWLADRAHTPGGVVVPFAAHR